MSEPVLQGPSLVLPLMRLAPPPSEAPTEPAAATAATSPAPVPRVVPRLLHLDDPTDAGLAAWAGRVRESAESCLLVDEDGRVVAMSRGCGGLLGADPARSAGSLLLDLLHLVDFSATALPLADPSHQVPPLRVLRSGGLARALVRVRRAEGVLSTYDVVAVSLAGRAGALAFFVEV